MSTWLKKELCTHLFVLWSATSAKKRLKFYYKLCIIRYNCIDMQFMDKLIYKVVILLL